MRGEMQIVPVAIALVLVSAFAATAQSPARDPRIGYVYPAGASRGSEVLVSVGGQQLGLASRVHITGAGVSGTVTRLVRPLNPKQLQDLREYMTKLRDERLAQAKLKTGDVNAVSTVQKPLLPDHPMLDGIETMSLQELKHVAEYFMDKKKQPNVQIAETLQIRLVVEPGAEAGIRELRIETPGGLTNPLRFEVGTVTEVVEKEVKGSMAANGDADPFAAPVVFNGQITPGDVDRFRFHARQGEQLIIETHARDLMPYLADAVPGWFQAVVALRDAKGHELAFADDHYFSPDPVLQFDAPADGDYIVEITDALYRGRDDFVYRIAVGDSTNHRAPVIADAGLAEQEPNDGPEHAQAVAMPAMVRGTIAAPGDVDVYRIDARAGEEIVVDADARALGSPLDSAVHILDATGNTVAWNDDAPALSELLTHAADSYVRATAATDGPLFVRIADAQHAGDAAYAYTLRIGAVQPDFALRIVPSSINVVAGRSAVVWAHASRIDGFDGEIHLSMRDAPAGFRLDGARIPAGADKVRMTITAPVGEFDAPTAIQMEGKATIGGNEVVHAAIPADDMMQAFAYRHLVPSQALLVDVLNSKSAAKRAVTLASDAYRIAPGGTVVVEVRAPGVAKIPGLKLELSDPPAGISLENVAFAPMSALLTIRASEDIAPALMDNVIVEAYRDPVPDPKQPKSKQGRRTPLGVLPAIPMEVVAQ